MMHGRGGRGGYGGGRPPRDRGLGPGPGRPWRGEFRERDRDRDRDRDRGRDRDRDRDRDDDTATGAGHPPASSRPARDPTVPHPALRKRPRAGVLVDPLSRQLYQLVIKQLHHDGFLAAAAAVADATGTLVPSVEEEGDRLTRLVANGLVVEGQQRRSVRQFTAEQVVERYVSASKLYVPLCLSSSWTVGRRLFKMRERFTSASLGGPIRDVSFSPDGSLVSCAGTNGIAVVFSLETMEDLTALDEVRAANRARGLDGSAGQANPRDEPGTTATTNSPTSATSPSLPSAAVTRNANEITELAIARRYHEHTQSVEVMRFHPSQPILLTGGYEGDLYLRDYAQPESQVLLKLHDNFPIRSAAFHPNGEYVLFGTDHTAPRLVNTRTGKIMTTPGNALPGGEGGYNSIAERLQHSAGLSAVAYSPDGRTLATASLDGSWMLYDGTSGRVIHRFDNAHSAVPVTSLAYSRTGQIVLTAGMDSIARLWDLRRLSSAPGSANTEPGATSFAGGVNHYSAPEVMSFGDGTKCEHRHLKAVFSWDESHVLCQEASLFAVHAYCVYSGDVSYSLVTQPTFLQRGLAASPYSNLVITGADDSRVRLWTPAWLPS